MTDFAKTISNSVGVFGQAPTSKWDSFLWGEKWAYGNLDVQEEIGKTFNLPVSIFSTISVGRAQRVSITNSISVLEVIGPEYLTDGQGYSFRFAGSSSDLATRAETTWTGLTETAPTYVVKSAATATTWS